MNWGYWTLGHHGWLIKKIFCKKVAKPTLNCVFKFWSIQKQLFVGIGYSAKYVLSKILQTCVRVFFSGLPPSTLLKRRLRHKCFLWNHAKFLLIHFLYFLYRAALQNNATVIGDFTMTNVLMSKISPFVVNFSVFRLNYLTYPLKSIDVAKPVPALAKAAKKVSLDVVSLSYCWRCTGVNNIILNLHKTYINQNTKYNIWQIARCKC